MGQRSKFLLDKTFNSITWKNNIISNINITNLYFKYKIFKYLIFFFLKKPISYKIIKYKLHIFNSYSEQLYLIKKIFDKNSNKYIKRIYISQLNLLLLNNFLIFKISTITIKKFKVKIRKISVETFIRLGLFYLYISKFSNKTYF